MQSILVGDAGGIWVGRSRSADVADSTDLLELLDGTLVNTTALVDQVTSGSRLSGCTLVEFSKSQQDDDMLPTLPESTWPMTTRLM